MTDISTDAKQLATIKAIFNESSRKLLTAEPILMRIIKGTAKEYKKIPLAKMHEYIAGKPSIDYNKSTFTINISTLAPVSQKPIHFAIHFIEWQKAISMETLLCKGISQICENVAAQQQCNDEPSFKLLKEYSIWLCLDTPIKLRDCISEYTLAKKDLIGITPDCKKYYDKISIIFVYLSNQYSDVHPLIAMLNTLLSPNTTANEKINTLKSEHSLILSEDQTKTLCQMCDFASILVDNVTEDVTKKVTDELTQKLTNSITNKVTKENKHTHIQIAAEIARDLGASEKDIPFIIGRRYNKSAKDILKIIS